MVKNMVSGFTKILVGTRNWVKRNEYVVFQSYLYRVVRGKPLFETGSQDIDENISKKNMKIHVRVDQIESSLYHGKEG
jgi:hypothetical protein